MFFASLLMLISSMKLNTGVWAFFDAWTSSYFFWDCKLCFLTKLVCLINKWKVKKIFEKILFATCNLWSFGNPQQVKLAQSKSSKAKENFFLIQMLKKMFLLEYNISISNWVRRRTLEIYCSHVVIFDSSEKW